MKHLCKAAIFSNPTARGSKEGPMASIMANKVNRLVVVVLTLLRRARILSRRRYTIIVELDELDFHSDLSKSIAFSKSLSWTPKFASQTMITSSFPGLLAFLARCVASPDPQTSRGSTGRTEVGLACYAPPDPNLVGMLST